MAGNTKTPIGIVLPIRKGTATYFDQSYDTLTQVRSNIINLLNTHPGERRMQPTFGSRLWTLNFEQNLDFAAEAAKRIVAEDIAAWVPGVTVTDIDVSLLKSDKSINDRDIYRLHIALNFVVDTTKQTDTIELDVDSGILN
jgi:phage baseplate assembly protein W